MKRFKKSTAIVLTVLFSLLLVVGFVFSFIPMNFGAKKFVSLSGSINISSDITGGLYGEYDIKTENAKKSDIIDSMAIIKDVFEENGYKNINVYAVGKSKIRAEVSFPNRGSSYSEVFNQLKEIGAGAFSLRSTYELEDNSIILDGSKCVKEIKVYTYNDTKGMSIIFNEAGQEKYKQLLTASSTIYLVLGDYSQSIQASNVTDYTQLTLQNTDWDNLIALEQKIKLGCMKIELNPNTAVINTMSASLSAGEASSTPIDDTFASSTAYVVSMSALLVIIVAIITFFAVKFGYYALLILATLLLNTEIFLTIMWLIPSVEIGLSTIAAMVIGVSIIYAYAFAFASKVKEEYNIGKSVNASLESAYKKQLFNLIISNVMLFLASLILFAFSFGELSSVAIVFTICMFLSLFTNLFIVPVFIKIGITFGGGRKLFMLKKRADITDLIDDEELAKEEE